MGKPAHICFVVTNYPTKEESVFTFVRELIHSIANLGVKCSVIAPTSASENIIRRTKKRKYHWQDITEKNNIIDIYQPRFFSVSNLKILGISVSSQLRHLAVINAYKKNNLKPDYLYAHFWDNGITASIISEKYNIPLYVATGESKIDVHQKFTNKTIDKYSKNVEGVIAVSSKNKKESIDLKLAQEKDIKVFPNAINNEIFHKKDKNKARKELGFSEEDFIIAFTGAFNNRKGVLRLSEASKNIEGVKVLYIGSGELEPEEKNTLFIGRLPHAQIPLYLNTADVFVLPTLAEGSSNAIIEAMACGLPIISSEATFNDDILHHDNSIRINSMNVNELREAIILLKNNSELKNKMSNASLKYANSLRIEDRATNILKFMKIKT